MWTISCIIKCNRSYDYDTSLRECCHWSEQNAHAPRSCAIHWQSWFNINRVITFLLQLMRSLAEQILASGDTFPGYWVPDWIVRGKGLASMAVNGCTYNVFTRYDSSLCSYKKLLNCTLTVPSVPVLYWPGLSIPNLSLENTMACHVYWVIKLGLIKKFHSTQFRISTPSSGKQENSGNKITFKNHALNVSTNLQVNVDIATTTDSNILSGDVSGKSFLGEESSDADDMV